MKRLILRLSPLFFCLIFLTSCWSSKELNEIGIATAIGIDKAETGYMVTAQIINPGEIASKNPTTRTAVTTYRASGTTIFEAFRRLTLEAPRKMYFSHVQKVVFGEELAEAGIQKPLDFLSRDHEMRTDFLIVIAKGTTADKLLNILTPMDKIPASKMVSSLEMSEKNWAPTKTVKLDELINTLASDGHESVLTGVFIKGEPQIGTNIENVENVDTPTTVNIDHLGVFKDDKLIGWLNEVESKGLNYFENNVTNTVVNVPCSEGDTSVELIQATTKVKGRIINNVPTITAVVRVVGNVGDVECEIDLTNPASITKLEEKVEKDIQSKMEEAVTIAQNDFNSDIFGFGEIIHLDDPHEWRRIKDNWDEEFKNVKVNYQVHASIQRLGTITDSFQRKVGD